MTARPGLPAKARASLAVAGGLPVHACPVCDRRLVPMLTTGLMPPHATNPGGRDNRRCPGGEQPAPTGAPR